MKHKQMGLLSKIVKTGVGLAGNWAKGALNAATGGTAGVLGNKVLSAAHKHSGVLGKVIGGVGRAILNDNTRNALSSAADTALKFIPGGKVKDTLSRINNVAQGRDIKNKFKDPKSVSSRGPPQYDDYVHKDLNPKRSTTRLGRL